MDWGVKKKKTCSVGYVDIARGRRGQANEFISESRLRWGIVLVLSEYLLGRVPNDVRRSCTFADTPCIKC